MAITTTTLSAAITAIQTQFAVASTTNITAPVLTTGTGFTFLLVDKELMWVTGVPVSGTVQVVRGFGGTKASAHNNTQGVVIGLPSDFPAFQPAIEAFAMSLNRFGGVNAPVAAAATLVAPGECFHVTGTTASSSMTPPTNFVEGEITIIADGIWTWTSSTAANGFAQAGTVTSGGTIVKFRFDAATSLWYASRVT